MAVFSEGGFSSPDIWLMITYDMFALLSILLNPLVFKNNIGKKRSLPRDLFLALSTVDFVTSVVMGCVATAQFSTPKEEQCVVDHNDTFCNNEYYKYNRTASVTEKTLGGVLWSLTFIPMAIT